MEKLRDKKKANSLGLLCIFSSDFFFQNHNLKVWSTANCERIQYSLEMKISWRQLYCPIFRIKGEHDINETRSLPNQNEKFVLAQIPGVNFVAPVRTTIAKLTRLTNFFKRL